MLLNPGDPLFEFDRCSSRNTHLYTAVSHSQLHACPPPPSHTHTDMAKFTFFFLQPGSLRPLCNFTPTFQYQVRSVVGESVVLDRMAVYIHTYMATGYI